jgi:hypothetical protein
VNKLYTDSSTGLTLDDFTAHTGHPILAFDLSPDDGGGSPIFTSPRVNGVLTLNALWDSTKITENHTVILYLLWDNIITVDGRRNIVLDYVP